MRQSASLLRKLVEREVGRPEAGAMAAAASISLLLLLLRSHSNIFQPFPPPYLPFPDPQLPSLLQAMAASSFSLFTFVFVLLQLLPLPSSSLQPDYYATSCPNVESIVRNTIRMLFLRDPTSPAAMLRLVFHDCQVDGCDASILLNSGSDGTSEMQSGSNLGVRRLDWIDNVKARVEAACPQTVSCADIIALAGRDAVALNGGPDVSIPLGRLDGFDASSSAASSALPSPTISVSNMLSLFAGMGMDVPESVAILGAHTLGVAHCTNFANRLYPVRDPNMALLFANTLRARCPRAFPSNAFAALDTTNLRFDNAYFANVLNGRGLLTIDSELGLDPRTGPVVQNFAANPSAFFDAFASAFVKLTANNVREGSQGEVRINCHTTN